jgi:hypothetical protein
MCLVEYRFTSSCAWLASKFGGSRPKSRALWAWIAASPMARGMSGISADAALVKTAVS